MNFLHMMTLKKIQRTIFWIMLAMSLDTYVMADTCMDGEFKIKQGIRSQREAFKKSRAMIALDCVLLCFGEDTCRSFNYAEPTSVNGEENCELLHDETENVDDEVFNSLLFIKDDRYAFYQISGRSHKPANTQKIAENAIAQESKPASYRSCLDHFNHGSKTSGNYTILDWQQKPRAVYCDMESEPGFVWTLVMSFTRANKDLESFLDKAMYHNSPANKYSPNWSNYRMSLKQMTDLKNKTTHWRATCSFPTYKSDIYTHYVRGVFEDFDVMDEFWAECKKVEYISVMGQNCSQCTSPWWQGGQYKVSLHIYGGIGYDIICDIKFEKSNLLYFGGYHDRYSTAFRCTATSDSTTNYWFGSYTGSYTPF